MICSIGVLLAGLAGYQARAPGPLRLDVNRDTWVSEVGREADGNNGAAARLKLKSIQEMSIVDIDPKPLRGRVVRSAGLHLKVSGEEPLRRVTVSSVGAEWFEGTGTNYARQAGGATFRHRRFPDLSWSSAKPAGDLCNVVLGNGGTIWGNADASPPDRDGWQTIAVRPEVVAARAAGLSYGFLVFDDTGSEFTHEGDQFKLRLFPNRFVYSRDQNRASAPYFTVELGPEDHLPPGAPAALKFQPAEASDLPPGEALVSWTTPRDDGPAGTLGFVATVNGKTVPRELIPMAGAPGSTVEMHLRDLGLGLEQSTTAELVVKAVDGAGNVGPGASATIRFPTRKIAPLPGSPPAPSRAPGNVALALPRVGAAEVAVLDELDVVNPRTGAIVPDQPADYLRVNSLWNVSTRTITLHAARNEFVAFQVLTRGGSAVVRPRLTFAGPVSDQVRVSYGRYQMVPTSNGPMPDPIVPLEDGAAAPPRDSQSLHIELYVPHDARAGTHEGTLALFAGPNRLPLVVKLTVWDFELPDRLSFLPEMNCYGLPENEGDFYRLAHRHRTVLNRLPYNQNGRIQEGAAPRWDGKRLDWTAWDRRFGPLLDGSAFADLPRKGVPVECFYLPLHENWPTPMEGNYNGSYWADEAFPPSYRQAFVSASRQIAEHLRDKGWNSTLFHGFLNNKNNFKARGWSRGSSPWLLDEPANWQDYWALRYFGLAFHEGIDQARKERAGVGTGAGLGRAGSGFPRLVYRIDDSRPQWRRDALDGLVNYHVVGSAVRQYPRLVFDRKRKYGEIVVEYGGTNPIGASNLQPVGWSLDAWALGTDGVLPWQTVGTAESWNKADELSLFYPLPPGSRPGVIPSVRLKAYRRGQQDVEYLTLWARRNKLPRWAVGRQVREALNLSGARRATETGGAEDAGRIDYSKLRPQELEALRVRIGGGLSGG